MLSRQGRGDENILGLDVAMHDVDGVHWRMQWVEGVGASGWKVWGRVGGRCGGEAVYADLCLSALARV